MNSEGNGIPRAADFWSKAIQPRVARIKRISLYGGSEDVIMARRTIDDELAAMHVAMCDLRTHRNSLAPISGLPLETLTRILHLHAVEQPPSQQNLGWIRVTHVCRAWRDAAISHAAMWSHVTATLGPRWLELMLHRAKSVPLSCQLNCGQDSEHFVAHILPHLSHIHRLSVSQSQTLGRIHAIVDALKSPAPILRALELTLVYNGNRRAKLPAMVPDRLFDDNMPMLRRLCLNDVSVPWSAPVLRGLTYLHIALKKTSKRPPGLESDFLSALEGMPALETLYLMGALPTRPSGPTTDFRVVQLACLQRLTFKDEGPRCLGIFRRLEIPSSCRLHFEYEYGDESALDDSLPLLRDQLPAQINSFHTLSITVVHGKVHGLELWRESSIHDPSMLDPPIKPDVFVGASCRTPFTKIIQLICDALPLDNIRTILIPNHQHSNYDWRSLFADNCRRVENIFVGQDLEAFRLCSTLCSFWALGDKMGFIPGHPFFPDLKLLALQSINLRDGTRWDIHSSGKDHLLIYALDECRARGRPISVVRLERGCIIDTLRLNALRDIVHVEWDPDVVQDTPQAPTRQDYGFVYSSVQHLPLS